MNVQGDMVKSHKHYMWHEHLMDHTHYMNHQHYTGGTTGEDSPDHSHNINHGHGASGSFYCYAFGYNGERGAYGPIGGYKGYGNTGVSVSVNDHNGNSGGASARHKHSFGAWSGGSCYLGTDTGRDYVDGAVKWNGSQYVDRSWTDGPRTWNAQGQEVDRSWTDSNDDNSFENRPKNLTIRIWKRIR